MTALDKQEDGTHYTDMKMQPVELAYALGATPAFCKLAKYLTREKNDKMVNLNKAQHCIELEDALKENRWKYPYYCLVGMYYKYINKSVHPLITLYSDNDYVQNSLQSMLEGRHHEAKGFAEMYKDNLSGK